MIKTIKKYITMLSLGVFLALPVMPVAIVGAQAPPPPADNDINNGLCSGADLKFTAAGPGSCDTVTVDAGTKVDSLITTVINIFSIVVGVVSVIMIIIGGLKYITSGGDSGNITGAKNTILYAIIGLVVVALAQVVVKFVLFRALAS